MPAKGQTDQFANYAILSVTESAANTLTFKKLETGISLNEKVAWVINRVEYFVSGLTAAVFNGDTDNLSFGLAVSNTFATASLTEPTIIDLNNIMRLDFGTAAVAMLYSKPQVKDFSAMPGGGIIVPPVPIYAFAVGSGLVSATSVISRIFYTLLPLAVDQYWELVEARRVLSS
jgi:hypothetical protein